MVAECCPICKVFVSDWIRQPAKNDSEFYLSVRRKGILRRLPEISYAMFRITRCLLSLTHETIVESPEYKAHHLLDFYKSGADIMNCKEVPEEDRTLVRVFYRNEFIKCIFKQSCSTDLEYVLAVLSDEGCSKEPFILSQWVADSLFMLRPLEMIHNDHKDAVKF
uniref:Uncharacterized protein n=1 Tax=viral metagenome TaxID=1070528 RepID=A0A6C0KLK3_9ZZZZ